MTYTLGACRVVVDDERRYLATRFPDGTEVGATPNTDPASLAMAAELGYGADTWAMSRDHELAHTWIAHVEGRSWSPTLYRLGHPSSGPLVPSDDDVAHEEARVLDFQRRLDKSAPRPWDATDASTSADH